MQNPLAGIASSLAVFASLLAVPAHADKMSTLETPHYRVAFEKKHQQLAGEVLKVAESVWPTLCKAYECYDRYQRITIQITDDGDDANGFAIYNFSRVMIFAPHMDWVMRNRQLWIQNVVTHELAHVFSLRRAAWLSPFDAVELYGSTYNYTDKVNYSFQYPWVPLVAPTWYVEGIAQFEAYMNGNDSWDSQRDMVVRDAYLTGTLPTLDFIETFEPDEDWTQAERCYNTGYAFLIYLKDRFGADKVRALAKPKPLFNFSWSVREAFGRDLTELFEDFKRSLAAKYIDYKEFPVDSLADKDMVGGYQQNLAFSPDGKYMAWLGNAANRRYPLNWIYWKPVAGGSAGKSDKPKDKPAAAPAAPSPGPAPEPAPLPSPPPVPAPDRDGFLPGQGPMGGIPGVLPPMRAPNPTLAMMKRAGFRSTLHGMREAPIAGGRVAELPAPARRSDEYGSAGLEFNRTGDRLLTARQGEDAQFTDLWEYEYRANKGESEKWHRLTWEERAAYPSYHPEKALIAYSRKQNGSSNLAVLDSTGRTLQLTNFSSGEQVYNPRFTPKGDSIYFTLGMGDKEAIVSINADAPGFNPFMALKDSTVFPDSLPVAKGQKLSFVIDWRQGALRNLRFAGDTLFFASNSEDSSFSVYDVYARIPGDSALYRATHVAGQATEPLVRGDTLYYQGFRKQQFRIFKQPLSLSRTSRLLGPARDTVPAPKPKKIEYEKIFESGEYGGTHVAADITPYLAVEPVFLSANQSYTDFVLGLNVALGEAYGSVYQAFSGAITKRTRLDSPLNYQFQYMGALSGSPIRHTSFSWDPGIYYSVYHDIVGINRPQSVHIRDIYPVTGDSARLDVTGFDNTLFSRWAASAEAPLPTAFRIFDAPYYMSFGASYWQEFITEDVRQVVSIRDIAKDTLIDTSHFVQNTLRDASDHRHYESHLSLGWSKGMLGTFLPTGGGLYATVHKYWATYAKDFIPLDSINAIRLATANKPVPGYVPLQAEYDPWSVEGGVGGIVSIGRLLSVFANTEAGMFLNRFPTVRDTVHRGPTDTIQADQPEPGLWVMSYRLGYYRMSGYPYNFNYRGRDIMEGSFYTFGQAGLQIPIKIGAFLPGLPTTSLKQLMLTGLGEWGTTLLAAPNDVYDSLYYDQYHLLLDVGARLSANFKLYHQWPFTVYAQVFMPINNLKAANLYSSDYPIQDRRIVRDAATSQLRPESNDELDWRSRKAYIDIVKQPRFYLGFNLGLF
jgi:hypothetical protein